MRSQLPIFSQPYPSHLPWLCVRTYSLQGPRSAIESLSKVMRMLEMLDNSTCTIHNHLPPLGRIRYNVLPFFRPYDINQQLGDPGSPVSFSGRLRGPAVRSPMAWCVPKLEAFIGRFPASAFCPKAFFRAAPASKSLQREDGVAFGSVKDEEGA